MAFEEERSFEQCIVLALLGRFQKRSQICHETDYFSILLVWKVNLSALSGVISLHLIARFLFYHMDIFIWYPLKRHINFQGISKFRSSRKTPISASQCSLEICPFGTPTRIQVTYFKVPAGILASANISICSLFETLLRYFSRCFKIA